MTAKCKIERWAGHIEYLIEQVDIELERQAWRGYNYAFVYRLTPGDDIKKTGLFLKIRDGVLSSKSYNILSEDVILIWNHLIKNGYEPKVVKTDGEYNIFVKW